MEMYPTFNYGFTWTRQSPGNSTENPPGVMYPDGQEIPEMQPLAGVEYEQGEEAWGALEPTTAQLVENALDSFKSWGVKSVSLKTAPPAFSTAAAGARWIMGAMQTLLLRAKGRGEEGAAQWFAGKMKGIRSASMGMPLSSSGVSKLARPELLIQAQSQTDSAYRPLVASAAKKVMDQFYRKGWALSKSEKEDWLMFIRGGAPTPTASASDPAPGLYADDQGTVFRWDPPKIVLMNETGTTARKVWKPGDAAYDQVKENLFVEIRPWKRPLRDRVPPVLQPVVDRVEQFPATVQATVQDTIVPALPSQETRTEWLSANVKRNVLIGFGVLGVGLFAWALLSSTQPPPTPPRGAI